MRPAPRREPTSVPHSTFLAQLLTLCLVLQWGGARIFNFDPSAMDGGTKGTALSQVLLFSTNAVALWIVLASPNARDLVRRCWPIMLLPGLAIVSAVWSVYPYLTLRAGISYAFTTLLGFALAGALPPVVALAVLIRAMSCCCLMSVLVALLLPELGVHQATDTIQMVHAGYWRGILGHKIGLGIFAGITLPLLLFYGRLAFRWSWPIFAACALACIVNASSMTANAGFLLFLLLLPAFRLAANQRNAGLVNALVGFALLMLCAIVFGAMNWLAVLFDKSTDLTGRADMWPFISAFIYAEPVGRFIGYGYVAGMKVFVAPAIAPFVGMEPSDAHSGYLESLVAFGYLGSLVVFVVHLWLFKWTRRLLLTAATEYTHLAAIPISLFFVAGLLNYSESLLMSYASIFTELTPLVAAWVYQLSSSQVLTQGQRWPRPGRSAPQPVTGPGRFPEFHNNRSPSAARKPGPHDVAEDASPPLLGG
jgi:exopolysaccharide production protein ExoQ